MVFCQATRVDIEDERIHPAGSRTRTEDVNLIIKDRFPTCHLGTKLLYPPKKWGIMIFQFWDDSNPTSIQSNHHLHSSFGVPQLQKTLDTYGSLMGLKGGQHKHRSFCLISTYYILLYLIIYYILITIVRCYIMLYLIVSYHSLLYFIISN